MVVITDPTKPHFGRGHWTWDGAQWRRQPLLFGYSDEYSQVAEGASEGAASDLLAAAVVPSGEVWVITTVTAFDETSAVTRILLTVFDGTTAHRFKGMESPAAGQSVDFSGWLVVSAGSRVRATFYGCTDEDVIKLVCLGFKLSLEE